MDDSLDPPRQHHRLGSKVFERINGPASPGAPDPNDVRRILATNLHAANNAGLNDVKPLPRRKSRRLRDYLSGMVAVNSLLLLATFIAPVFGIAGLVLFNIGFSWTMWIVIDDY